MTRPLHIVGLGGTTRSGSSSEQTLRIALGHAELAGATTRLFGGTELAQLPMYSPDAAASDSIADDLVAELRRADGVIVASPGYHGSISGLVKNALDHIEDLRDDERPYLADRSVGLIVTAYGWQAAVTTLAGLRVVVHALRGWVTPYGATINTTHTTFADGRCDDHNVDRQLRKVAEETMRFAQLMAAGREAEALSSEGVLAGA
ncbi:NADPH-dependent FMN reductase [Microbacterium sp. A204]|uniref:NADPH-dependent FMN reductase n=1 Tax=Microbacterium sp. A204 TaxID=3457321 RepID=UPI003FD08A27